MAALQFKINPQFEDLTRSAQNVVQRHSGSCSFKRSQVKIVKAAKPINLLETKNDVGRSTADAVVRLLSTNSHGTKH